MLCFEPSYLVSIKSNIAVRLPQVYLEVYLEDYLEDYQDLGSWNDVVEPAKYVHHLFPYNHSAASDSESMSKLCLGF